MTCDLSASTTDWLAIGLLLAVVLFAWLMHSVKRRLREAYPALWKDLDDAALPLHRRVVNSARLLIFVLLGRYTHLLDRHLNRVATGARLLLVGFLVGGILAGYCQ